MSITLFLVIITCSVSIYAFGKPEMFAKLTFNAYAIRQKKEYVRILGHAFIHTGWLHLGINMFVLWQFGQAAEEIFNNPLLFPRYFSFGKLIFVLLYFSAVIISSLPAFFKRKNNPGYNAAGASGAVSALVFCLILIFPRLPMGIIFIPVKIPAFILGFLYLIYSFFMSQKASSGIAHDAHFSGAVYGFIYPLFFNPQLAQNFIFQITH